MTTPKRILLAAIHYPVASGRYIARAFKRLGHDVRTVGPTTGNQIWGMAVDEKYVWQPDYTFILKTIYREEWEPDLVVYADSADVVCGDFACPYVVWGVDNHVRGYKLGFDFDHYFLAHHDGPVLPVDESRNDMTWLPCAYDPEYFTPSPIPMAEREYDVCMVGVAYPRRVEIVEAMRNAGLKVFAATGLLYEDYRNAYWNSRISLCVSAAGDVAQRVFETAAMGCAILTDPLPDLGRIGGERVATLTCNSTVDFVSAARTLLEQPVILEITGNTARDWAKPHTWDARAQVVLDTMFGGK